MNQPSDVTVTANGVKAELKWNPSFGSQKTEAFRKAQMFVDSEVIRRSVPLAPKVTGFMRSDSPQIGTAIGSGHVIYQCVYARRQYYEHKTMGKWFEKMKSQHKESIMKGAAAYVAGNS